MGWTAIDVPGGRKPAVSGLGPYRESIVDPVDTRAALVREWRSTTTGHIWFLTLFTIVWNGFITASMMHDRTHSSWGEALRDGPWIGFFILVPVSVGFSYLVVAIWVNQTRIEIDSKTVVITRGPLPWRGRLVTIAASTLQQLYVQEYVSHEQNDQPVTAFRVMARLTNGRDVLIDRGMKLYTDARALEQWIEKRLKIVDEPVAGEAGRPA